MKSLTKHSCDVLIIGSGAAGLSLALRLAPYYQITIISKAQITETSTLYAQGGVATVLDENDSIESHINDTLISGANLCEYDTVKFIANNARHCIDWLINQGVNFDKESCSTLEHNDQEIRYHLTQEGGHSHRRILHSADATGRNIENILVNKIKKYENICIFENTYVIDLIISNIGIFKKSKVIGAWLKKQNIDQVEPYFSRVTVLATGGAAQVYKYTTNPDIASGDGIAMGWRAGCRVANLEFNQFHPTCLYHPKANNFLLTEALRGEGAWLVREDGSRFMLDFDTRAELAPRDIVTRSIDYEMKRLNVNCMYLDITHQPKNFIYTRFPNIYKKLLEFGLDLTTQLIPIVPAAHYTCGGVVVDLYGRTDIHNLYAIGEVSYTGLHGANRIASNSLLECLVYGWSAANHIISSNLSPITVLKQLPVWNHYDTKMFNQDENIVLEYNIRELKILMWNYMGIIRSTKRLERALHRIHLLRKEMKKYYMYINLSNHFFKFRNLLLVSELMVRSALKRKESRGLHYTLDFPKSLKQPQSTILIPSQYLKKIKEIHF